MILIVGRVGWKVRQFQPTEWVVRGEDGKNLLSLAFGIHVSSSGSNSMALRNKNSQYLTRKKKKTMAICFLKLECCILTAEYVKILNETFKIKKIKKNSNLI